MYPPCKSFYEIVSDQFRWSRESAAVSEWMSANLSRGEIDVIRTMRGPFAMFFAASCWR